MLPRELMTARLRLRIPRADDAEAVFTRWASDPRVTRYLTWRAHASVDDTRAFLERCAALWEEGEGHLPWIIEGREGGGPLGMIGVTLDGQVSVAGAAHPHRANVGYVLGHAYWGKGLMTEAAREVVRASLAVPSIFRVWAVCDVENPASGRVLEKAGMRFEGTLARWMVHPNRSSEPRDCHCYAAAR